MRLRTANGMGEGLPERVGRELNSLVSCQLEGLNGWYNGRLITPH